MIELLLIILSGSSDRLRGDSRGFGGIGEAMVMGACIFALTGSPFNIWLFFGFCLLWAAGSATGWGSVIGGLLNRRPRLHPEKREKWQTEWLYYHPWVSAFLRGFIWGAPVLLLSYWEIFWEPVVAMTIAFPLSLLIGRDLEGRGWKIFKFIIAEDKWDKHELVRGVLCALLTFILVNL